MPTQAQDNNNNNNTIIINNNNTNNTNNSKNKKQRTTTTTTMSTSTMMTIDKEKDNKDNVDTNKEDSAMTHAHDGVLMMSWSAHFQCTHYCSAHLYTRRIRTTDRMRGKKG